MRAIFDDAGIEKCRRLLRMKKHNMHTVAAIMGCSHVTIWRVTGGKRAVMEGRPVFYSR